MTIPNDVISLIVDAQIEKMVKQEIKKLDSARPIIVFSGELPPGLSKEQVIHDMLLNKVVMEIALKAGLN